MIPQYALTTIFVLLHANDETDYDGTGNTERVLGI